MFKYLILLTLIAIGNGASQTCIEQNVSKRIIGGAAAAADAAPFQVAIRTIFPTHLCGGAIITDRWILTSAHGMTGYAAPLIKALVGTNTLAAGGIEYSIILIVNHPIYIPLVEWNDISLLKTEITIEFSPLVQPVAIGTTFIPGGVTATLSGWGYTSYPGSTTNNLQIIQLNTITNEDCASRLGPVVGARIIVSSLCTFTQAGQGTCVEDSGSPLVFNNTVIGIVSWGKPCATGYPDVYTRVEFYKAYIEGVIEHN